MQLLEDQQCPPDTRTGWPTSVVCQYHSGRKGRLSQRRASRRACHRRHPAHRTRSLCTLCPLWPSIHQRSLSASMAFSKKQSQKQDRQTSVPTHICPYCHSRTHSEPKYAKQTQSQDRQTSAPAHTYPSSVPDIPGCLSSLDALVPQCLATSTPWPLFEKTNPIDTLQHRLGCRPERVERVEGAPLRLDKLSKTNPM